MIHDLAQHCTARRTNGHAPRKARQTLDRPRIARTALVEGPKGSLKFEQSDALIPRVRCVVLVSEHISGRDIRAAPMLLLRMFETPHCTVARFRKDIKAVPQKMSHLQVLLSIAYRVQMRRIASGAYLSRNRYLAGFADRPK